MAASIYQVLLSLIMWKFYYSCIDFLKICIPKWQKMVANSSVGGKVMKFIGECHSDSFSLPVNNFLPITAFVTDSEFISTKHKYCMSGH